jgi:quercetin dioxygenase-like cupin family protein
MLRLHQQAYPLYIDVAQRDVAGLGTAMRFELPRRGVNFPLRHQHERKLVVALGGQLLVRLGNHAEAHLKPGSALLLQPGCAHRVVQQGDSPAIVGVALWPGHIEQAFRDIATWVDRHGYQRQAVEAILAPYGVAWDAGLERASNNNWLSSDLPDADSYKNWIDALDQLPASLAAKLSNAWAERAVLA